MSATEVFLEPDFLSGFIDLYRQLPCLWDQKSKDYVNKLKRDAAYDRMRELMATIMPEATKKMVKDQIGKIRRAFMREYGKVTNSIKSGAAGDDVYVPRLWYYSRLRFIKDVEVDVPILSSLGSTSRARTRSQAGPSTAEAVDVEQEEEEEQEAEDILEPTLTQESQEEGPRSTTCQVPHIVLGRKRARKTHNLEEATTRLVEEAREALQKQYEECESFGNYVTGCLSKCSNRQRKRAEEIMVRVLGHAQEEELTSETHCCLLPHHSHAPPHAQHLPSAPSGPPLPPGPQGPPAPSQQLPQPMQQYQLPRQMQQPPQWQYGPGWQGDYTPL